MAPITARGLARRAFGLVGECTDGAETVYAKYRPHSPGTCFNNPSYVPSPAEAATAAQTEPAPRANFVKIWVKAKTSCGTSPIGFAGYSKASQHVFFVRTH